MLRSAFAMTIALDVLIVDGIQQLGGRIVGGTMTTIDKFPFVVSLESYGSHFCGGSLIKTNAVLTAAHCTYDQPTNSLTVRVSSSTYGKGGNVTKVIKKYDHPQYSDATDDYDVSILILRYDLELSKKIQTIKLHNVNSEITTETLAMVLGWGALYEDGPNASNLHMVEVPRVSHKDCMKLYAKEKLTKRMICFGYIKGGKDSCQGDSGGPLIVRNRQIGIVSWGYGCAQPKKPGVYTKIYDPEIHDYIIRHSNLH